MTAIARRLEEQLMAGYVTASNAREQRRARGRYAEGEDVYRNYHDYFRYTHNQRLDRFINDPGRDDPNA